MSFVRIAAIAALAVGFDACAALHGVPAIAGPASSSPPPDSTRNAGLVLAASPADDLAPTSAVPWNPPGPMHPRKNWERVLLLPGWLVSLPLEVLDDTFDRSLLYVEETAVVQKVGYVARELPQRTGVSLGLAKLGDRTGLGARIEARAPTMKKTWLRCWPSIAHSASLRNYHLTEVRVAGEPLALEYEYGWRPQDRFFGIGMDTFEDSLTNYATQREQVALSISHDWNDEVNADRDRTYVGAFIGPRTLITRRGRAGGDERSYEERFPEFADETLNRRFEHLVYGGRISSDWRLGIPHWSYGWRTAFGFERFDKPLEAIALRNGRGGGAQFTRTSFEFETGRSFMRDPRTLRILGRLIDTGVSSGGERMMIEDLPTLGGRAGLYGFPAGRFHDLDAVLFKLSYVFPLVRRFEIDLHAETGGVFADLWDDAQFAQFEQSFGLAFRGRTSHRPFGSIGIDFSRESVRLRYSLGTAE